jgi:hypothetical protein
MQDRKIQFKLTNLKYTKYLVILILCKMAKLLHKLLVFMPNKWQNIKLLILNIQLYFEYLNDLIVKHNKD